MSDQTPISAGGAITIATPCKSYLDQQAYWHPCRTLMGGTAAMRAAGKTYLPQEPAESPTAYQNRLARTTLYNEFGRAVRSITGKVLEAGVKIKDDTPPTIAEFTESVDRSGRDLERFLHDVVEDAMAVGRSHVLVDFPKKPEGVISRADEIAAGLRPYWFHIKVEDLIYWKLDKGRLVEIRIKEYDEYGTEQIRQLTETEWTLWQQTAERKDWIKIDFGVNTMGRIALATFYTRRIDEMVSRPPLEDLAYKNIEHWQSSSDQRHILHIARVPILFGTGFEDGTAVTIGPNQLVKGPLGSELKYVEHTGAAIAAGKEDLERIEMQMQILALAPTLQSKTGTQTATAKAIDTAEAQTAIKLFAADTEDAVDLCFLFTGLWLNIPAEQCGGVEIECDWSLLTQDPAGLVELGKARALGDISRDAYLNEFKRRGILSEEFDIDEDAELCSEESQRNADMMLENAKAMQELSAAPDEQNQPPA